jgi:hypothetical protein
MRPTAVELIPAIGYAPLEHPDQYDMREAPVSLNAPEGSTTVNYDKERQTIVIKFYESSVNPELIRRAINQITSEYGPENVVGVEVFVSDRAMAGADGMLLINLGYDRVLDANVKSGLYRFRKAVKLKKVEVGK